MRKNQSSSTKKRAVYWSMCQFLDGNVSESNSFIDHIPARSECEEDESNDENISEQNSFDEVILPLSVEMNHENDSNDIAIENCMEVIDNVFQENSYEVSDNVNLKCPPTKQVKDVRATSLMQYLADTEEDKKQFKNFLQDVIKSTPQEDEVDVFFKSMAMTVKKLRPDLITKAKMKVFQTVMEFEILNQKS
ncbi:hypothetical protein LSTR_LSTR001764 [Laodelphax striatellus]|uniref:BESS domain-containing protein n=1 Tax=Laodelphax striatellus TaxID=195883 RepID=A0A482WG33_LAOST|nr:hypothetical protein LSTR_LSTR001764 [Laodelphax striatellus]